MAQQVADYRKKLEEEHKRLLEFAGVFNHRFVTDNNKCFQTALMLLNKLRSGISEVKRIYLMFCPRWNHKNFPKSSINNQIRSVFDYSIFSIDSIQYSLFELDEYPPCVQGLYNELSKFFSQLNLSKEFFYLQLPYNYLFPYLKSIQHPHTAQYQKLF